MSKYRTSIEISSIAENYKISDERIYRKLATKMVNDMPINELSKLIKFTKIDPHSQHSDDILSDPYSPECDKRLIWQLRKRDVVLYEAESD